MTNKIPDIAILQEFLNETPPGEVINRLKDTLGNRDTLKDIFFSETKVNQYLPMLNEARKNGHKTYETLTKQVEAQCGMEASQPAHSIKNK